MKNSFAAIRRPQGRTIERWQFILLAVLAGILLAALFSTVNVLAAISPDRSPAIQPALPTPARLQKDSLAQAAAADLSVTKSHTGNFQSGSSGVYSIVVTNAGDPISGTIVVTDTLPDELTYASAVGGDGWEDCTNSGQVVTCVYSTTSVISSAVSLPAVFLTVTASTTDTTVVTNTVVVSGPSDTNLANNTDQDATTLVPVTTTTGTDLGIVMSGTPAIPSEGNPITYTLVVTNYGPQDGSGVVVTDTVPTGLTYFGSIASAGSYNPLTGLWTIGSLASGSGANLKLVATVGLGTSGQTITNTATVGGPGIQDPKSSNNTASVARTIAGTVLTGRVTDFATGTALTATVIVTDSASHIYSTTASSTGYFTFTGTITNPLAAGNATLSATRKNYRPETAAVSLTSGAVNRRNIGLRTADLVVTKSDFKSGFSANDTYTYTIGITNTGGLTATSVIVTDTLPSSLTYITDTLGITHTIPTSRVYVWELEDDLDPGDAVSFKLRVRVANSLSSSITSLTNTVRAGTKSLEADTADNVATDVNTVGTGTVSFTNSVSPSSAANGKNFTFTLKLTNNLSSSITNVTISQSFSSYLDLVSVDSTRGSESTNSRTATVTMSSLSAGSSATVTVVVKVNNSATSTVTQSNTASVTYTAGGSSTTKTSNSVSYTINGSSTLPSTGFGPAAMVEAEQSRPTVWFSLILGGLALAAILGGLLLKSMRRERILLLGIGLWLALVAVLLTPGFAGWLRSPGEVALVQPTATVMEVAARPLVTEPPIVIEWPAWDNLETLPDYPVPAPQVTPTPGSSGEEADTSEINRIMIPVLGLNTVVKYVPFDGLNWMIAGLQQEVAWMGETSWPGLGGNTALAGHVTLRSGKDGPFRYLDQLLPSDEVTVFTEKNIYNYRVREIKVVEMNDMSVLTPTESPQLTLITCTDWNPDEKVYLRRLVIFADLEKTVTVSSQVAGN